MRSKQVVLAFAVILVAGSAWLAAQDSTPRPRADSAVEFAKTALEKAPSAPSHPFAHGEFSSVYVAAPPGAIPLHYHAKHDETVVIVRGEGRMRLGEDERSVKMGDVVFIPKGTPHDFRPDTKQCVAVSIFAPFFDGKDRIFIEKEK